MFSRLQRRGSNCAEVVKPDYTAPAVPPDSSLADPSVPTLGDLWRVGFFGWNKQE